MTFHQLHIVYGSWWNVIQQPLHSLGRGKAYAIWELVKHHSTTASLSWQVQGLCYMGVGEASFNSRFTLLAGARPMLYGSWWNIIQQPLHSLGRCKAYAIWELVKHHSTAASLSWQVQGLCFMGVGETSFNNRFTLLAGARPMLYGSWWKIIQQPLHSLGRCKAYALNFRRERKTGAVVECGTRDQDLGEDTV